MAHRFAASIGTNDSNGNRIRKGFDAMVRIALAEDFSSFPAGRRHPADGPATGERFRKEHLVPAPGRLGEAERLEVSLDGVEGRGSSFLDEAFGGLVRNEGFSRAFLEERLRVTTTEPDMEDVVLLARRRMDEAEP